MEPYEMTTQIHIGSVVLSLRLMLFQPGADESSCNKPGTKKACNFYF
uniref:Uncharacterized protein n=1 Tax=Arundo donax TaxID=35708 RepID=A0A0A9TLR3_ARUDO